MPMRDSHPEQLTCMAHLLDDYETLTLNRKITDPIQGDRNPCPSAILKAVGEESRSARPPGSVTPSGKSWDGSGPE